MDVYRTVSGLAFDIVFVLKAEPEGPPSRVSSEGPFLELTGYTREELNAMGGFRMLIHRDDVAAMDEAWRESLESDDPVTLEFRLKTRDGEFKWMRGWMKGVTGEDGEAYIHGAAQLIDELKRADDERRRIEERYRALAELTSDYSYSSIVNEDGSMEFEWDMDTKLGSLPMYTPDEVSQAGWGNFIIEEDLPIALESLQELQAGRSTVVELRVKGREGELRWMRAYSHRSWIHRRADS
jgi:PAS domain S-box-containing protein